MRAQVRPKQATQSAKVRRMKVSPTRSTAAATWLVPRRQACAQLLRLQIRLLTPRAAWLRGGGATRASGDAGSSADGEAGRHPVGAPDPPAQARAARQDSLAVGSAVRAQAWAGGVKYKMHVRVRTACTLYYGDLIGNRY